MNIVSSYVGEFDIEVYELIDLVQDVGVDFGDLWFNHVNDAHNELSVIFQIFRVFLGEISAWHSQGVSIWLIDLHRTIVIVLQLL